MISFDPRDLKIRYVKLVIKSKDALPAKRYNKRKYLSKKDLIIMRNFREISFRNMGLFLLGLISMLIRYRNRL